MATPLQYSCLENPTNRGARQATVHAVAELATSEHTRGLLRPGLGLGGGRLGHSRGARPSGPVTRQPGATWLLP